MDNRQVVIVEDEAVARRRLMRFMERQKDFDVIGAAENGKQAIALIRQQKPDVLIFDIELKDMTAFDVIAQLPNTYAGKIIFLTAFDQYAVKAFEVFALDYILKPFTENRLLQALQRLPTSTRNDVKTVQDNLNAFTILENKICLTEGKTQHFFEEEAIIWLEAEGYHVKIHLARGESQLLRSTLKNVMQELPDFFLRVNRSQAINLKYLARKTTYKNEERYTLLNGKAFIRTHRYME